MYIINYSVIPAQRYEMPCWKFLTFGLENGSQ